MVVYRASGGEILSDAAARTGIKEIVPRPSGTEPRRHMRLIWADEGIAPVFVLCPKNGAVLRVKVGRGSVRGRLRYQKYRHLTPAGNGKIEAKIRVITERPGGLAVTLIRGESGSRGAWVGIMAFARLILPNAAEDTPCIRAKPLLQSLGGN